MKPKIFIDGEHGTTGLQIRTRLAERDDLEVISIPEAERRNKDLRADYLRAADIAILCLPDDASKEAVSLLEGHNSTRIIDTSTTHRVHPDWAYGFAELAKGPARADRRSASRCQSRLLSDRRDCACPSAARCGAAARRLSGKRQCGFRLYGGGKQLIAQMEDRNHPDYLAANNFLYGLPLKHKHVPELQLHGRLDRRPIFSPSVGRFPQGMIVQVPLFLSELEGSPSLAKVHAVLTEHYAGQDIVEVVPLEESAKLPRVDAEELAGKDGMKLFVLAQKITARSIWWRFSTISARALQVRPSRT
ncbi:N-acetyl-gamma-glutamyl-phosphate reductase [Brucella melitensis]|nr:N-acetyl-gamma-glutamyl-phosphate reductase [Brucella melitensis]